MSRSCSPLILFVVCLSLVISLGVTAFSAPQRPDVDAPAANCDAPVSTVCPRPGR